MKYNYRYSVEWQNADGSWSVHRNPTGTVSNVNAVSRKHALDKALQRTEQLPCFSDRRAAGMPVDITVTLVEV